MSLFFVCVVGEGVRNAGLSSKDRRTDDRHLLGKEVGRNEKSVVESCHDCNCNELLLLAVSPVGLC